VPQSMRFWPMCAALGAAAVSLLCACASTSPTSRPRYQAPPTGAPAAELVGHSMVATGLPSRASVGHVSFVDGIETSSLSSTVRVAPGVHRVGIDCFVKKASDAGPFHFNWDVHQVAITGSFVAGQKYYVRCEATNGETARIWVGESPDAQLLPQGFNSVCTRSCPGSGY
jgi:hypothetical protein